MGKRKKIFMSLLGGFGIVATVVASIFFTIAIAYAADAWLKALTLILALGGLAITNFAIIKAAKE